MSNKTSLTPTNESLDKAKNQLVNLDANFQDGPSTKAANREKALDARLQQLETINNSLIGRLLMSQRDRDFLQAENKFTTEALHVIREGENNNLQAMAEYGTRYLKSILHNLVLVGEANLVGASKIHYELSKQILHDRLLNGTESMLMKLQEYETRADQMPEKYRLAMIKAIDKTLTQWVDDFDFHLDDFARLLEKTFSK